MRSVSPAFTIDIRRFAILRELRRRGTVTDTAEALHLTASAVSQQLAALSREAGVPLLQRHGRRVRLTGQATILLEHADRVAAQLERARVDLLAWSDGRRGSVTIGAFSSAISGLLPHLFARLASAEFSIDVGIVEAEPPDLFTQLDRGDVDLAIAVDFAAAPPHTDRRYSRTDLLVDVLDIALPPTHRLAGRDRIPLRALATEPWIIGDPRSCCGAVTRSICAANGFTPDIRHATNDWNAVSALVEAGAGVALIPRLVQPRQSRISISRPEGSPPSRNIFVAQRAGSCDDPVLGALTRHLLAAADTAQPHHLQQR